LAWFKRKSAEQLTDEVLAARYRETGQREWVGELFRRYTYAVIGVGYQYLKDREDARDLAMQVFEKLLVDLREHRVEHVKPWLFAVVRNAALMELRKRKSARQAEERLHQEPEFSSAEFVESDADWHLALEQWGLNGQEHAPDRRERLMQALGELNSAQQRCVTLFYLEQQSYQQVAERTGFSLKEVKSHLQNGRRNLQIRLQASENGAHGPPESRKP
jgi:RNA polymerase sigma factor (sigma-70 family)